MRRAGPQNPGVSLFPFLAVLICTMGVMMLLLVVCNRPGGDSGATDTAPDNSAHAADSDAEIAAARDLLSWKIAQLTEARKKTEADLEDRRLRLSAVEGHMRALRDEWERMHHAAEDLERVEQAKGEAVRLTEAEIAELKQQVERAKGQVALAADRARHQPPSFAIIPYDGQNGTRRRPIYIECGADRVTIQPEGIVLTIEDFEGPSGSGNPLATVLRAVRDAMAASGAAGGAQGEPYPLLIVRPDGIGLFYGARAAMASWASEFGYELVEQDRKLVYPPPNPHLAEIERTALADARARYAWYANTRTGRKEAAGPRPMYRASITGGGIVRDGQASGDGSGGPMSEFGGRRTGFGGPGGGGTGVGGTGVGGTGVGGTGSRGTGIAGTGAGGTGIGEAGIAGTGAGGTGLGGPGIGGPGVGGPSAGGTGVGGTGFGGPESDAGGQPFSGSFANRSGPGSGFGGPGAGVAGLDGAGLGGAGAGGTGMAGPGFGGSGNDVGGHGAEVGTPGGYGNPQMASLPPNSTIAPGSGDQRTYGTLGGVPTANPTASGYAASSRGNGSGSNGGGSNGGGSGGASNGGDGAAGGGSASGDVAGSGEAGPNGMISLNGAAPASRDSNSPDLDIRPTPPSGPHPGEFVDSQPYTPPPKPKADDPDKKPKSLADKRGRNWSLPSAAKISVPVTRPIHIECRGDQLVILPDPGNPEPQVVPFAERTEDSIDKLVAGVWKHTKGWGIAGRQMYWHPVLVLQLGPSGEGRFNEVQALMANSGLEVQRR